MKSKPIIDGEFVMQVGKSYREFYGEDLPANRVLHCRGIVDGLPVVRYWRKRKRRWEYEVLSHEHLFVMRDILSERKQ